MTLEKKRLKLKKLKPMNLQKQTFTRRAMQFSLKNPNYPSSLIRMRFNINGTRGSYYLPLTYKIESVYWDSVAGCAIIDPKRNPKLKGNPQLQTTLNNVNREIEKTANELMSVVESLKTRDIIPTYTIVKAELIKRLRGSEKTVEVKNEFKDFVEVSPPTRLRAACRPLSIMQITGHLTESPNPRLCAISEFPKRRTPPHYNHTHFLTTKTYKIMEERIILPPKEQPEVVGIKMKSRLVEFFSNLIADYQTTRQLIVSP